MSSTDQIPNIKKALIEGWIRTKGQKRQELHISHLIHCLRKSCFEILDPHPQKIDERTFRHFLLGASIHSQLQEILGEEFEIEKEVSYFCKNNLKIIGHIDAFHKPTKTVVEFKTSNAVTVKDVEGVYPYHLKQLQYYMALVGASRGILLYIIMGSSYLSDYFPEYHLTCSEEQRRFILRCIERDATELERGISSGQPNSVSHILDSPTYITKSKENWFCNSCLYKKFCNGYHERYRLGNFPSDAEIIENFVKKRAEVRQQFNGRS